MATDYLRLIYTELMKRLATTFPNIPAHELVVKFFITTPAMWSAAAQHNTLQAAREAGFGSRPQDTIEAVTEPEAAASYVLKEINSYAFADLTADGSSDWQAGDPFISPPIWQ